MIALIEKLFGSAPAIMGDTMSWLLLLAGVVVLAIVACLLPKGPVAKKVIASVCVAGVVAVLAMPLYVADSAKFIYNAGSITYLLIVVAVVLLYGLFCGKSNLAQALYGITVSIILPLSLLRILVPTWLPDWVPGSIAGIFKYPSAYIPMIMYAILFFVAVWLVSSGAYRLTLNTIWHILYGFVVFGSVMVFTTEAGLSFSHTSIEMLKLVGADGLNLSTIADIAIICGLGLGIILVISLIATLWRKCVSKSGEKVIASETKKAFVLRLVGKIVAVAASGVCLVFLPTLLGASVDVSASYDAVKAGLVGMPTALAFLAPIVILAVVMLVFEFFAEDDEIKVAQAKYEAETSAE